MQPDADLAVIELRSTFPSREAAERCAADLVDRRLAACVQVDGPLASIYRWQGNVEMATEYRCTCKTSPARAAACESAIVERHPYDVPEVLRLDTTASLAYATWVRESVAG